MTTAPTLDEVAAPPTVAVQIRGLTKHYGTVAAVDHLDLDVTAGGILGLIGPNGAGKTTTMLALATLLIPDSGTIEVLGHDALREPRKVRGVVGWMPDFFGLYDGATCREYLEFFGAAFRLEGQELADQVGALLELVGLDHKAETDVSGLSRGMQQRLSLARALVHDPKLLILDEPASGLDPRARVDLREILLTLEEMGHTMVVSSHILAELEEIVDEVAIIEAGKVLAQGSADSIRAGLVDARTVRVRLMTTSEAALAQARDQAMTIAAKLGAIHVGTQDRQLRFDVPGGEETTADLLAALVAGGLRIVDFREESGGLERLFLSVTKGIVR